MPLPFRVCPGGVVLALGLLALAGSAACVGDDPSAGGVDLCPQYCDAVLANCPGDLRAFDNADQCKSACALLDQGTEGDGANTVGCRLAHAKVGNSPAECRAASAFGGGVCGQTVDTFCGLIEEHCIMPLGDAAPYPAKADCVEALSKIRYDENASEGTGQDFQGDDTVNCRMLHFILSLAGPADQKGHCPHTGVPSAVCHAK